METNQKVLFVDAGTGFYKLKRFDEETIETKQQRNCGEPCSAMCKKMNNEFKKDYEPYQTMGPLCGIFDQRAAEKLNHKADMYGFDAISVGGVLSWLMECLSKNLLKPNELGVSKLPATMLMHAKAGWFLINTGHPGYSLLWLLWANITCTMGMISCPPVNWAS